VLPTGACHRARETGPVNLIRCLGAILIACWLAGAASLAEAGNQREEALADSVRLALSRAITDPRPPKVVIDDIEQRIRYIHWLSEMSVRLERRMPDQQIRHEFLETVWY